MPDDELVLGLPRSEIDGLDGWRGVREAGVDALLTALARHGTFRARREVEDDPSWKQVIPYVVLRDGERIFLMRRTRAGGDPRLHERYSIGVGGHVNPSDGDLAGGLEREWREELAAPFQPDFEPLGLLNGDDDPVGAVHLGVVFAADAAGRDVVVQETDKLTGSFVGLDDVAGVYDRLESWSQLVYDHLRAVEGARRHEVR